MHLRVSDASESDASRSEWSPSDNLRVNLQAHLRAHLERTLRSTVLDDETIEIGNDCVRKLLRHTCSVFGGHKTFGSHPIKIGNKSLRSGAATSLFLMDPSPAKIMILGRWSLDAFLVYIRPQVLEWTNNMSRDMISFDSFLDVGL